MKRKVSRIASDGSADQLIALEAVHHLKRSRATSRSNQGITEAFENDIGTLWYHFNQLLVALNEI